MKRPSGSGLAVWGAATGGRLKSGSTASIGRGGTAFEPSPFHRRSLIRHSRIGHEISQFGYIRDTSRRYVASGDIPGDTQDGGDGLSAFLGDDDMVKLTGYKRPADQIRWLRDRGIPHTVNARNRPVVLRDLSKQPESTFELGPVR